MLYLGYGVTWNNVYGVMCGNFGAQMMKQHVLQLVQHRTYRLLIPLLIFSGLQQGFMYTDYNLVGRHLAKQKICMCHTLLLLLKGSSELLMPLQKNMN